METAREYDDTLSEAMTDAVFAYVVERCIELTCAALSCKFIFQYAIHYTYSVPHTHTHTVTRFNLVLKTLIYSSNIYVTYITSKC